MTSVLPAERPEGARAVYGPIVYQLAPQGNTADGMGENFMRVIGYTVPAEDDGRQIKYVLRSRLLISHRQLSRLKACDGMRVNGAGVHANYAVHEGDKLELWLEADAQPERDAAAREAALESIATQDECRGPSAALSMEVCAALDERCGGEIAGLSPSGTARTQRELAQEIVVYEDEDMLVINKPAPLPTGASARQGGLTLESVMYSRYGGEAGWQFRPVNRLDKGTSGLMAAARTAHAHFALQRQLHTPAFTREYRALTVGAPEPPAGTVDLPIGREPDSLVKRRVAPDGRPCRTHYETLWRGGDTALLRLRLETGRTHQIRVHMAALGCPVLGDFLYGCEDERLPGRFALHSHVLACVQPVTGARLEFASAVPRELSRLAPGAQW